VRVWRADPDRVTDAIEPRLPLGTPAVLDADDSSDSGHPLLRDAHGVQGGGDAVAEAGGGRVRRVRRVYRPPVAVLCDDARHGLVKRATTLTTPLKQAVAMARDHGSGLA
jgi:hypothetical protein